MTPLRRPLLCIALLVLLPVPGHAQGVPEPPLPEAGEQEPGVLAITNAHLHPVTGEAIPDGTLLMEDGRIVALGEDVSVPDGARVVDVEGRHVMPGIVESHSHMGFKQLWKPGTGADNNELYRSINARTRAEDGLNARDRAFEIALAGGVTTMNITPGSRSPNSGQAVVTKLRAPTIEEMRIAHGGMKFAIRVPERSSTFDGTEEEVRGLIRSRFHDARDYLDARRAFEQGEAQAPPRRDLTLEAFGRLLEREWPVGVHAHGTEAMAQAIRLKEEFDLDLYIHHGEAVGSVMEDLLRLDVPVSFGIILPYRHRHDPLVEDAVEFVDRGGLLAFHQDHPDGPQYYLRETAALFVRNGMTERNALRALTINGARILGIHDRVGSLEVGKDADVLILDGPPLDWESRVERVFVEGREVYRLSEEKRSLRHAGAAGTASGTAPGTGGDVPAPAPASPDEADVAIVGGEIRTISGEPIPEGTVLIRDGIIAAVGADLEVPDGARVIDAGGHIVTPGFLDARTTLGPSRPAPGTSVATVVPPRDDHHWLRDGVTAVYASPTDREPVGGFGGVVKLAGPEEDRVVRERAGLSLSIGERALGQRGSPTTRQGVVGELRQRLIDARAEGDPALTPVLEGEVPVRMAAHTPDDLLTALRLAREFDLRVVLDLASGAHLVRDHLAEAEAPVVLGPSIVGHGGGGPYEKAADTPWNAAWLQEAGVPVAFSTDASGGRSVTLEALVAVGHGLTASQALRAVTLEAARILGVEDRLGSIETGKDADLVIWDGEPVSTWSEVRRVFVDGTERYASSPPP